jgi:ribosomal peptide maturation radical SAM protein 1
MQEARGVTLPAADLYLVQMPYSTVHTPSIGLGLLKGYAQARGLRGEVLYANLDWAEEIGLDVFLPIQRSQVNDQIGEWTFAGAAFPEHRTDSAELFRLAAATLRSVDVRLLEGVHPGLDAEALFHLVRHLAPGFVDRIARRIVATGARIVGCTSVFQQHCASLALLRRVKALAPEVVTMLGGANCEGEMGLTNHRCFDWLDIVVSGEADAFFGDLCGLLLERGLDLRPEDLPYGVLAPCHRAREGQGYPPAPRAVVTDMDATATPVYDDYFAALEASPLKPFILPGVLVETSRGCWWGEKSHCTFCGLNGSGMAFRAKSPARALAELAALAGRYGIRRLECVDNILDMRYFKAVLPALAGLAEPYHLFYEVKPNLRRDQLEQLAAAGIRWLQPGIESLDDRVLDLLGKGGTGIRNIQLLKWSRELGTRLAWGFLHGVPGEDDDWYLKMAEWVPWLSHLQAPNGFARIRYDRFSPYHMAPERFGIHLSPLRIYRHVYPLAEEDLRSLVYYFEDYSDLSRGDVDPTRPGRPRPGLDAMRRAISQWSRLFWGSPARRPVLVAEDDGQGLTVRDTRPVAVAAEHRLAGVARWLHLACDRGLPADKLVDEVRAASGRMSLSWEELRPHVEDLIERRLVLKLFDRYLALATRPALAEYPSELQVPEGFTDLMGALRARAGTSLARFAKAVPLDQPLAQLFA